MPYPQNDPYVSLMNAVKEGFDRADLAHARDRAVDAEKLNVLLSDRLDDLQCSSAVQASQGEAVRVAVSAILREVEDGVAGQPGRLSEPGKLNRLVCFIREVQIQFGERLIQRRRDKKELRAVNQKQMRAYIAGLRQACDYMYSRMDPQTAERIKTLATIEARKFHGSALWKEFYESAQGFIPPSSRSPT